MAFEWPFTVKKMHLREKANGSISIGWLFLKPPYLASKTSFKPRKRGYF
ncbi:hypothetical protein D1AOALGA4SA_5894 [Olavius algarvensis Delta 1 endosymbiont]|nr:hypothetical protein D1AOALGA4SA_5894 [Olavius algarvensis Delta 1 endosymbiont]